MDTPTKLGEHKHDDVIGYVVLPQVLEEAGDSLGDVFPQLVVHSKLVGVAVKATVVAIQDAGAQVGLVNLGNAPQLGRDGSVRVLDRGSVGPGGFLQDVSALKGVQTGLAHVVHNGAGTHDRGIQPGEAAQDLLALLLFGDAGEQPVRLEVIDAGYRHARHGQRTEQGRTEADGGQDVFLVGVDVAGGATQPALGTQLVGLASVPDVHRPEVRPRGIGVTDTVDDTQRTLFIKGLHGTHFGVQRSLVVQAELPALGNTHCRPIVPVQWVGVGDHRVQVVVAAGELQHHQNRIFVRTGHFYFSFFIVGNGLAVGCRRRAFPACRQPPFSQCVA